MPDKRKNIRNLTMQTFSLNALAESFEVDRSTMIRCMRGVAPDLVKPGNRPQWKIATAARSLEQHRRKAEGNGAGADPDLQRLYDEHEAAEARMRALPTLTARREAARRMLPLIAEMDRAVRQTGIARGRDAEAVHLNADAQLRLVARGIEAPCEMTFDQVWKMMNAGDA
jgi:hypothetical protein